MDFGDAATQNRRSDANLDDEDVHEPQPRFSDYQYVPEWEFDRNSTAVVLGNVDVRISGYSDQVIRRQSMASFRSDDRVSVIHRDANEYEALRSSYISEVDDLATPRNEPETPKPATHAVTFPTSSTMAASGEPEPSRMSIEERRSTSPPTLLGPDRSENQQPSIKGVDVQTPTMAPKIDKKDTPSRGTQPTVSDNQPAASRTGLHLKASAEPPTVKIVKSYKIGLEDPCFKVLPAALIKYNIQADWREYALYIVYGDQERCVGLEEKPLILFKELDRQGKKPAFMLRHVRLASSTLNTPPPDPQPKVAGGTVTSGAAAAAVANRPPSSSGNRMDAGLGFSSRLKSTQALVERDKKQPSPRDVNADVPLPFSAVSLFEFIVGTTKTEAGFPYLAYLPGEVFEIIAERGKLWLARGQMGLTGWIWKPHFSRLPKIDSAVVLPDEAASNKNREGGASSNVADQGSNAPKPKMVEVVAARTKPEAHSHSVAVGGFF